VIPDPFQPQKVWNPGHAPVVAPLARFAYSTPASMVLRKRSRSYASSRSAFDFIARALSFSIFAAAIPSPKARRL